MFFFLAGLDGPDLVRKLQPRVMNVNLIKITDQVFSPKNAAIWISFQKHDNYSIFFSRDELQHFFMLISVQIFVIRGNEKFRTALWVAISRSPARFRPASPARAGRGTRAAEDLARSKDRRDETISEPQLTNELGRGTFFVSVSSFFNERVSQLFFSRSEIKINCRFVLEVLEEHVLVRKTVTVPASFF